jgi:hypothetical protein
MFQCSFEPLTLRRLKIVFLNPNPAFQCSFEPLTLRHFISLLSGLITMFQCSFEPLTLRLRRRTLTPLLPVFQCSFEPLTLRQHTPAISYHTVFSRGFARDSPNIHLGLACAPAIYQVARILPVRYGCAGLGQFGFRQSRILPSATIVFVFLHMSARVCTLWRFLNSSLIVWFFTCHARKKQKIVTVQDQTHQSGTPFLTRSRTRGLW